MGPAPHGAGGLKSSSADTPAQTISSRPARGGWIEILCEKWSETEHAGSRPARGGWIEMDRYIDLCDDC